MGFLRSREFWTIIIDVIVSAALYFCGKYLAPSIFEDVKFVIGVVVQPVAAAFLLAFFGQRIKKVSIHIKD